MFYCLFYHESTRRWGGRSRPSSHASHVRRPTERGAPATRTAARGCRSVGSRPDPTEQPQTCPAFSSVRSRSRVRAHARTCRRPGEVTRRHSRDPREDEGERRIGTRSTPPSRAPRARGRGTRACGGGVFYDVGANSGYVALEVAKRAPEVEVIAFEPQPGVARTIAVSAALNLLTNVRVYAAMLGCDGTGTIFLAPNSIHA